jgi:hypothetical protein
MRIRKANWNTQSRASPERSRRGPLHSHPRPTGFRKFSRCSRKTGKGTSFTRATSASNKDAPQPLGDWGNDMGCPMSCFPCETWGFSSRVIRIVILSGAFRFAKRIGIRSRRTPTLPPTPDRRTEFSRCSRKTGKGTSSTHATSASNKDATSVIPTEAGAPATAQRRNLLFADATRHSLAANVEERRFSAA